MGSGGRCCHYCVPCGWLCQVAAGLPDFEIKRGDLIYRSTHCGAKRKLLMVTKKPRQAFSCMAAVCSGRCFGVEARYSVLADVEVYTQKKSWGTDAESRRKEDEENGLPPVAQGDKVKPGLKRSAARGHREAVTFCCETSSLLC